MPGIIGKKPTDLGKNVFIDDTTLENKCRCKNYGEANYIHRPFHYYCSYKPVCPYIFILGKQGAFDHFTKARNTGIHQVTDHDSGKGVEVTGLVSKRLHQDLPSHG